MPFPYIFRFYLTSVAFNKLNMRKAETSITYISKEIICAQKCAFKNGKHLAIAVFSHFFHHCVPYERSSFGGEHVFGPQFQRVWSSTEGQAWPPQQFGPWQWELARQLVHTVAEHEEESMGQHERPVPGRSLLLLSHTSQPPKPVKSTGDQGLKPMSV